MVGGSVNNLSTKSDHAHKANVKLGARAGGCDPTGRMEVLRPSAAGCQPTSESITDAQRASEDGRSRRSAPGASPPTPSEASGVAGVAGEGRPSAVLPDLAWLSPFLESCQPASQIVALSWVWA